MLAKKINYFLNIFLSLLLVFLIYYFRGNLSVAWQKLSNFIQPCQKPITYSIENFDHKFGLSQEEFLQEIKNAEKIWEQSSGRDLFSYQPSGHLKINLIYDSRQKATDELEDIGLVIKNDQSSFDALKKRYEEMSLSYDERKVKLDILVNAYEEARSAYERDVERSNRQGGASKNALTVFEQRRADLNNQVALINKEKESLNILVESINSTGVLLNNLINTLNLKIDHYNTVGASNGEQFNEGEYIVNGPDNIINIYQFSNRAELVAVLAHELGHALGLDHVDDRQAIMYYLNESGGEKLTDSDLVALQKICRIK